MNSGAKFDNFKNSLASLGKNSQSQNAGSQARNNTLQESNFSATHDNTANRGMLRSAIKFDYELGQMKIPSANIKQVDMQPSANIFSCMDSPNYQRDFEVSPKIMHYWWCSIILIELNFNIKQLSITLFLFSNLNFHRCFLAWNTNLTSLLWFIPILLYLLVVGLELSHEPTVGVGHFPTIFHSIICLQFIKYYFFQPTLVSSHQEGNHQGGASADTHTTMD